MGYPIVWNGSADCVVKLCRKEALSIDDGQMSIVTGRVSASFAPNPGEAMLQVLDLARRSLVRRRGK